MQPVSYLTQTGTPAPRSGRNRGLIIGGVIALGLVALSIFHYTGPTRTVQSFMNDFFVSGNADDAHRQLCSDTQAKVTVSQMQDAIHLIKTLGTSVDISGLTYTLADENFFGDAHVRIGGTLSLTIGGQKQSIPLTGLSSLVTLHSSGLGWCIENAPTTL